MTVNTMWGFYSYISNVPKVKLSLSYDEVKKRNYVIFSEVCPTNEGEVLSPMNILIRFLLPFSLLFVQTLMKFTYRYRFTI
jgi:hypothetical protein